ncbi:hypothetical protein AA0116_g7522 [Alternaria tenuissima]|nr:hypothetical protein AA0116_g7522 [Alternaria tenuissima]
MVLHGSIGATLELALSSATRGWKDSIIIIMCPARKPEALLLRFPDSRLIYQTSLHTFFAQPIERDIEDH